MQTAVEVRYARVGSLPSRRSRAHYRLWSAVLRRWMQASHLDEKVLRRTASFDSAARMRRVRGITRRPVALPRCGAEIVRAAGVTAPLRDGVVLYLHGGGFFCCGLNTHRPIVAAVSRLARVPVVSVDYRLIPSVTIDDCVDDCLDAYRWLLDQGVPASRIVVAGDSAGGFLTFALAQRVGELGMPAGLVGVSALLDLDFARKDAYATQYGDPFGYPPAAAELVAVGGVSQSPVDGLLAGLPPSLLIAAESEVLRGDAETMAERLRAAGREVRVNVWPGQLHAFPAAIPGLPESRAAHADIARFVRERLDDPRR